MKIEFVKYVMRELNLKTTSSFSVLFILKKDDFLTDIQLQNTIIGITLMYKTTSLMKSENVGFCKLPK